MFALVAMLIFLLRPQLGHSQDYPRSLLTIPNGGEEAVKSFVAQNMEPRHAIAVVVAGKGTKRHKLLQDLAETDEQLVYLTAISIQFGKGSSIVMHRYRYPSLTYEGRWTRSAIREWLKDAAFAPVNMMDRQFSPPKYLTNTDYGTVLIVKELTSQTSELVRALEPYAEMYRTKLKFTFFTKSPGTQKLCDMFGIWTNDELLLLEEPRDVRTRTHSSVPGPPKYRMEGVTPESIDRFFHEYAAGSLPRYYQSAFPRGPLSIANGIRELSGWDFLEVVDDPNNAVLVEFVSKNCDSCVEFAPTYQGLAQRVLEARRKDSSAFRNLTIARIDQSAHEHPETIKGTPWVRFWPRGARRQGSDVEARSIDGLLEFLEDNLARDSEESPKASVKATKNKVQKQKPSSKSPEAASAQEPASSAQEQAGGIRLPRPVPEAARSYLRTDEELPETGEDGAERAEL